MATVAHPIPSQKTGIDFLSASHFKISQDNGSTSGAVDSVNKSDYIPWDVSSKQGISIPPRPAQVLHKDDRFFNEKASETAKSFLFKGLPKKNRKNDSHNLRSTNFKMDSDLKKFNSFNTSHALDFIPKYNGPLVKEQDKRNLMKDFIPQGDPEKAAQAVSDYRERYRGHDTSVHKTKRAPSMHQEGPPTIIGDTRLNHFATTHNDVFIGKGVPRVLSFPAPVGTNIPQGDVEKENLKRTTQQASFVEHQNKQQGYNKNAVMSKLGQTNFKQQDGHHTWDTYQSTTSDTYIPLNVKVTRNAPGKHRNHSDFPEGDADASRTAERANTTTNRFYHGEANIPPADIVSGANKRTKSNVWFGEPSLNNQYYERTTGSTFKPKSVPYKYTRPDFNTRSCVPVNYYPNERHMPTTISDFQNPSQSKLLPNATALENLKKSHIMPPLGGERQFATEALDQYTAKYSRRIEIDPGRLQRSTVPLGTLKI